MRPITAGNERHTLKPVIWIGSSRDDIRGLPPDVRRGFGRALRIAQEGDRAACAKPLREFPGAGVLEIIEDYDSDTYRAFYTVRFANAIYLLHVFQKKSTHGIKTSRKDIDLVKTRLSAAERHSKGQR